MFKRVVKCFLTRATLVTDKQKNGLYYDDTLFDQ